MQLKHFFLPACLLLAVTVNAQSITENETPPVFNPVVYNYKEGMPKAEYDLNEYISGHLQYPDSAKENKVEGRVVVKFIVNEDGSISDCKIIKGIGSGCDEAVVRLIKGMPHWLPGRQNGKPVKAWYTLPVIFSLN